jgi:nitrogen fixation protein FixH
MRRRTALAAASVALLAPLLLAGTAHAATPVAVWHMENPGSMTDSSGNNNNSSAMTGITGVAGSSGQGYHFASNGSVTVPNSATLNPGTEDFSITVNVNFGAAPAAGLDYDLIRKGLSSTAGGEWKMEIFGNSTLASPAFCLFKDTSGSPAVTVRGTANLAGTGWRKITCAKTSTQVTVAVDGVVQRTNRTAVGTISNTADVSLGRKLGGGDQYVGDMDEVTIQKGPASPADTDPPTLTASGPTGNAVPVDTTVTATFSEPVQGVSGSTFTLAPAGGGTVSASVGQGTGNQWILTPTNPLTAATTYTATLTNGITDTSGNAFAGTSWTFTTAPAGDTTPPTVTTSPANTDTGVPVDTDVTATFSESVQGVSGTTFKLKVTATGALVPAAVAYDDASHTATLHPSLPLAPNTEYTARLIGGAAAIRDTAGNPLTTTAWTFTTGAAVGVDVTPPTVTGHTPAGTTGISRTANVTATFSEAVTNVTTTTFTLTPTAGGAAVTATVTFNSSTGKWVLNPAATLDSNTQYTATVVGGVNGVKDLAGNPLLADVTWSFTTAV